MNDSFFLSRLCDAFAYSADITMFRTFRVSSIREVDAIGTIFTTTPFSVCTLVQNESLNGYFFVSVTFQTSHMKIMMLDVHLA